MALTRFRIVLAIVVLVAGGSAEAAQTTPRTPAQELDAARQILAAIPIASAAPEAARRLDEVKRDFEDLAATYAAQTRRGPGDAPLNAPGGSWRLKLGIVNSDLRAASDGLDQAMVSRLNDLRARLDAFYAAAIAAESVDPAPQAPAAPPSSVPAPAPAPQGDRSPGSMGSRALLDRLQMLVDGLLARRPTGDDSLEKAGQIVVDRAVLVEIQTVLSQLRTMTQ